MPLTNLLQSKATVYHISTLLLSLHVFWTRTRCAVCSSLLNKRSNHILTFSRADTSPYAPPSRSPLSRTTSQTPMSYKLSTAQAAIAILNSLGSSLSLRFMNEKGVATVTGTYILRTSFIMKDADPQHVRLFTPPTPQLDRSTASLVAHASRRGTYAAQSGMS